MAELTSTSPKQPSSGIWPWITYDLINSILIINGSLHFSAWITQDQHISQFVYGATYAASTALLLILLPIKGAFLDKYRSGREILFLLTVILGVIALCLPGIAHQENEHLRWTGALLAFGLINFVYQASLVSYNWLLVHLRGVNNTADVRRVSGYGEAAGSIGSVLGAGLGVYLLTLAAKPDSWAVFHIYQQSARVNIFLPLSILFFTLAFVVFWRLGRGIKPTQNVLPNHSSYRELILESVRLVWRTPRLRFFLFAFLFFADALLTVQLFLPVYMRDGLQLNDEQAATMFAIALMSGAVGAFLYSRYWRKLDTRAVLLTVLGLWSATLLVFGFVSSNGFTYLMVWCGLLYGVLWSSSRAYLIELTPDYVLGRTFGLYAVFDRSASIIGPLLWGAIMALPSFTVQGRYEIAFMVMSVMVLAGMLLLHKPGSGPTMQSVGDSATREQGS